jgi:hypothetical protein
MFNKDKIRPGLPAASLVVIAGPKSAAKADYTTKDIVEAATRELEAVQRNPDAVIMDAFMRAVAEVE